MNDETDSVLGALLAALEARPDDEQLLLHLGRHLLERGDGQGAIGWYQRVLATNPVHEDALRGALAAARLAELPEAANGYAVLLTSLGKALDAEQGSEDAKAKATDEAPPPAAIPIQGVPPAGGAVSGTDPGPERPRVRGAPLRLVSGGEEASDAWVDVEDSHVYLDDVGGMEDVKRRLNLAFLGPLRNPEVMKAYGKSLSGGLLLYGPPGCGKTYIARALAGELGARFIAVGMTDILDMYVGESERKLHELFESARRNAPAVLFFDELDAIGQKRNQLRNTGLRSLVNQLLAEMDSLGADNAGLFVLAATNHPWDVDTALRRPGRFDRAVPVFPPDEAARTAILSAQLAGKPAAGVDVQAIARRTEHFSGADLKYLCDVAAEYAIEASMATGEVRPLDTASFEQPLAELRPSTRDWFETARNFAMFANETGSYDDLAQYIRDKGL